MKKLCWIAALLCLFMSCTPKQTLPESDPQLCRITWLDYFDTVITFSAYTPDETTFNEVCSEIADELLICSRLFDTQAPDENYTNLYDLNNAEGKPLNADERIIELLRYGNTLYQFTSSKFNPAMGSVSALWQTAYETILEHPLDNCLPSDEALSEASLHTDWSKVIITDRTVQLTDPKMRLDIGTLGISYAALRINQLLSAQNIEHYLLSAGEIVLAKGSTESSRWEVGINDPIEHGILCSLEADDICITSVFFNTRSFTFQGKEYGHIIDPDTLYPASYFSSVTVLCSDSIMANGLATTLFLCSLDEGLALIQSMENTEALWITSEGYVCCTKGFADRIVQGGEDFELLE